MSADSRAGRLSNPNILKSWKLRATLVFGLIAAMGLSACQGGSAASESLPTPEPTTSKAELVSPHIKVYTYPTTDLGYVGHMIVEKDEVYEQGILGPKLKTGANEPNIGDAVNAYVAKQTEDGSIIEPADVEVFRQCLTNDNATRLDEKGNIKNDPGNQIVVKEACAANIIDKKIAPTPTPTPTPTETPTPTMTPEPSATPTPTQVPPPGFIREITNTYDWAVDIFKRNAQMNPLSWLSYGAAGHLLRQVNEIFSRNYNFKIVDISILLGPLNLLIGFLQLLGNGLRILGNSLYENANRSKDK